MDFIERRVRSAPNLSHEDALESLQTHPNYRSGTKITSFRRRGERWVAVLHVPKTAGEFPPEDDGDEGPPPKKKAPKEEEGPDESSDGPPFVDDDGDFDGDGDEGLPKEDGPEKGKGGTEGEILHVLTEILHALKGGPIGPGLGGPDDLGPGGPPPGGPPPPHPGGPAGGPAGKPPSGAAAKLRPGEIANKPGVIPVGAPAFSSTNPLAKRLAKIAGRKRHIPVSSPAGVSIKEAKAELDPIAEYFGYKVAQVRYCGENCSCKSPGSSKIHALLEIA